jgi:sortase A
MRSELARSRRGLLSAVFAALGAISLTYYLTSTLHTSQYQRSAKAEVEERVSADRPPDAPMVSRAPARPLATGDLIGRVEIPRLKISAAVAEGDDEKTLEKAVGHLPDTPLPWDLSGNVGIAAHRDGLFRRLEHIKMDDDIRVVTPGGDYVYQVKRTHIVNPEDVWVLAPTALPTITLITCYPFSYVGHAPKRFIVQAELVGRIAGTVVKGTVGQ